MFSIELITKIFSDNYCKSKYKHFHIMNINGKDYKINIIILLMEKELGVTIKTIETLVFALEHHVSVSILLNGGYSCHLKGLCNKHDQIFYYESAENLGVAGGRNFLFSMPECKSSDVIMILDNDVIPTVDYVRELVTFLLENDDAGIVGGISADLNAFGFESLIAYESEGCWGGQTWKIRSSDIKEMVCSNLKPDSIYHMGVHPDYTYAYFSIKPMLKKMFLKFFGGASEKQFATPLLKFDQSLLNAIAGGLKSYPVSNVAGCSQVFRRSLLDEIGPLNPCFNPYGYEDSDFCMRAIRSGYANYITSDVWLFHGTDSRHAVRDYAKYNNMLFRGITILSYLHLTRFQFILFLFLCLPIRVLEAMMYNQNVSRYILFNNIFSGVLSGILSLFSGDKNILRPSSRLLGK